MSLTERLLSQKNLNIICLLSVIVLPGIWALLTFDKLAMTSEGWFAVYAKMILDGQMPYRDFELVLPPLYTYINVLVISVFGESLIAFRVIGVFLFVALAVVAYHIFKLIFPPWVATIVAIVAIFVLQSENAQVAYDYIRFYDLFNYLAFFLLLRAIVRSYKKEPVDMRLNLFLAGVMCALAALMRQTSGLIVFVYFAVFLVLIYLLVKKIDIGRKDLLFFFLGFLVPFMIMGAMLALTGTLTSFVEMTVFAGTKGSVTDMLFNWIPRSFDYFTDALWILTIVLAIFIMVHFARKGIGEHPPAKVLDHLFFFAFIIFAAVLIISLFHSLDLSSTVRAYQYAPYRYPLQVVMFVLNFILGLTLLFRMILRVRKKEQIPCLEVAYLFFCGFIFAVGYGSGTSAGLSFGQAALNFGFIAAVVLGEIGKISRIELKVCFKTVALAFFALLLATSVSVKVVTPYYWWGLTAENYSDAVYETDISYFGGIRLTADEKFVYEDFVEKAGLYMDDDDKMYCYSQIAMFYILADKVPVVRAPIPWFDIATDKTVLGDLDYLQNNNPKMIVFADHGYLALEAHENLFREGKESGQRAMYEWLMECATDPGSNYTVVPNATDPGNAATYKLQGIDIYLMVRNT